MDYQKKINEIIFLLAEQDEEIFMTRLKNARLMGGNGGEVLAIACSVLKTYEVQNPSLFNTIAIQAKELYTYAQSIGLQPRANFDLLDELDRF